MKLRNFILCILSGCLAFNAFICKVQYSNLVYCSKFPPSVYSDPFSISYSFAKVAGTFFRSILQYITLILLVNYILILSKTFTNDSILILISFTFYFYFADFIPTYYDTFITEQQALFNRISPKTFIMHYFIKYVYYLILLEIPVQITNHFYKTNITDDIVEEDKNEMVEVDYATENEVIHPQNQKRTQNPWLLMFAVLSLLSLIDSYISIERNVTQKIPNIQINQSAKIVNNIKMSIDSKHTLHSRIFLNGFFKKEYILSDNLFETMSTKDINALIEVLHGQFLSKIHFLKLTVKIAKCFLFTFIFRTLFNLEFKSFELYQNKRIAVLFVISFALYVPFVFLFSPFEVLLTRNITMKADCYASKHVIGVYNSVYNMYKWNGNSVKNSQIYKMFFIKEPTIDDRLIAIEKCTNFKK